MLVVFWDLATKKPKKLRQAKKETEEGFERSVPASNHASHIDFQQGTASDSGSIRMAVHGRIS